VCTVFYLSQPSYYCDEWRNEVSENPDTTKEYAAFKKGHEMTSVIQSVSDRLGFTKRISYGMYIMFRSVKEYFTIVGNIVL
jgi:hypothetical protein